MEIIEVTIGIKTRKEIMTFVLTVNSQKMSTSMEMNSSIRTELHTIKISEGEKGVNLRIKINPVHHMQGTMQLVLAKINPRAKQETEVTTKIKVQKETNDPQPKVDPNQRKRKGYLVKFAKKQTLLIYTVVKIQNLLTRCKKWIQEFP